MVLLEWFRGSPIPTSPLFEEVSEHVCGEVSDIVAEPGLNTYMMANTPGSGSVYFTPRWPVFFLSNQHHGHSSQCLSHFGANPYWSRLPEPMEDAMEQPKATCNRFFCFVCLISLSSVLYLQLIASVALNMATSKVFLVNRWSWHALWTTSRPSWNPLLQPDGWLRSCSLEVY
jgi:hypothetical protein